MDSTTVLTSLQSSVKQPLLDDPTIDSTSLRTRVEMRKQYKRRVDKSRLTATSAAYNFSAIDDDENDDVEDRQGSCDKLSLDAATSDTDLVTSSEQRTRSQSLDEQIIRRVSSGNTFLTPNNIILNDDDEQQQNAETIIDSPLSLPPKPPSAVWSESHSKREERRNNNMRTPSPNKPPVSRIKSTRLKPKITKRNSTVPTTTKADELSSTVADDVLMDRALNIRENLRQYEMQELAAEAERAAESGVEKYVGSASKYVEESPIQTPTNGSERKQYYPHSPLPFTNSVLTPQRSKGLSRGLPELDLLEFTPFSSTKKIRVTSLRKFSDVVPNFSDMHDNIRLHLERRGVDSKTLPEMGSRREQELMKNDTIESDAYSQAPSVTSGSVASFSSFATSSFKGMAELLGGRSRSNQSTRSVPKSLSINNRSASTRTRSCDGEKNQLKPLWEPSDEEERLVDKSASVDHKDLIKARRSPPLFPPVQKARSAEVGNFRSIAARESPHLFTSKNDNDGDGDSDDSSVELYGRKSPLNIPADNSLNSQHQQLKPALSSRQKFSSINNKDHSPSNKNNVSFVEDPLGLRSCSTGLLEPSLTKDTSDETGTVLSIFDRIQKQFSVSADNFQLSKKKTQKDNSMFVSNYFYTEKDDILESGDFRHLKIEINPKNEKAFCGDNGNCGNDDTFVSSCGMLGEWVTSALEWVNARKSSDATVFSNRSEATGFSNLYSTTSGHDTHTQKRIFLPPRLSERSCQGEVKGVSDENDLTQQLEDNDEFCVDEKWLCDGIDLNRENENSSSSKEEARMA